MSETFIKIDSLQHLEISRQTYPTNLFDDLKLRMPEWRRLLYDDVIFPQ